MTHKQIIKDYLTEHRGEWVNKLKLEQLANADDARPRIWDIRHKDGLPILERTSPQNGLAEYMYVGSPITQRNDAVVSKPISVDDYDWSTGTAVLKQPPVQERMTL